MNFFLFISMLLFNVPSFPFFTIHQADYLTWPLIKVQDEIQKEHQEVPIFYDTGDLPGWGSETVKKESDSFQSKFFNMLFLLGLLICFMILASWALKRMMKSKVSQLNTSSDIRLIDTRYLSPRATLYLVEVRNKTFLIAESPTAITSLTSIVLEDESKSHPS